MALSLSPELSPARRILRHSVSPVHRTPRVHFAETLKCLAFSTRLVFCEVTQEPVGFTPLWVRFPAPALDFARLRRASFRKPASHVFAKSVARKPRGGARIIYPVS